MKKVVCALFDTVTRMFLDPVFVNTEQEAVRGFRHASRDLDSIIGANIEDFQLFCLATYDIKTGIFDPDYHLICNGVTLLAERAQEVKNEE